MPVDDLGDVCGLVARGVVDVLDGTSLLFVHDQVLIA